MEDEESGGGARSGRVERLCLIGILGLGVFLRFWNLKYTPGWYHDECVFVGYSWELIHGRFQWDAIRHSYLPRLPLGFLTAGSLMLVFGKSLLCVRFLSAASGSLATWLVYRIGRTYGRNLGLLAAFFWATLPRVVLFNRWGFMYNLAALACLISLTALVEDRQRGLRRHLALAAAGIGAALLTEPVSLLAWFVFVAYLAANCERKKLLYAAAALVPLLGYIVFMLLAERGVFLEDIQTIQEGRLAGAISLSTRLDRLGYMWTFDGFWSCVGFVGVLILRPGPTRRTLWAAFCAWLFGLWWISGEDRLMIERQAILITPLMCVGLARVGEMVFSQWMPASLAPGLASPAQERGRRHRGAREQKNKAIETAEAMGGAGLAGRIIVVKRGLAVCAAGLLAVLYLYPTVKTVLTGYHTQWDTLCITNPHDAEAVAGFINARCRPGDVVIASHLDWMLHCRTASYVSASIADGGPGYYILPAKFLAHRLVYDCKPAVCRFLVLHHGMEVFVSNEPHVREMLDACIRNWTQVFESGEILVYENPQMAGNP